MQISKKCRNFAAGNAADMLRTHHISPFSFRPLILAGALLLLCLSSCTSIREAQDVVSTADSLRSEGVLFDDSAKLASAVSALEPLRLIYPTAYAHANYYYGRLLREAGNQPEAMLAFLRVVHSRTKDHEIIARSWSNIANMCRLAADHELAYEIYKRSAEEFLKANDSIAYYYAINNYAYECAEMRKKTIAFESLRIIEEQCIDSNVMARVLETKAEACLKSNEYDSVLFFINHTYPPFSRETSNLLLRAQAFSYLEEKDSALFYARQVINGASSWFEKNNAYYILANFDDSSSKSDVLQVAADRSDIQKLIEIRQGQLSQATQLLEQDLTRKPNLTWLWTFLVTLCIIATSTSIYIRKKKAKRQLISQQVEALQQTRDSLSAQTRQIENEQKLRQEKMLAEIELFCNSITEENMKKELCWIDFTQMCTIVNQRMFGLVDKLKARGITSMTEIRICVLLALDRFNAKQMANVVPCTYDSFKTTKSLIVKKLNVSRENIHSYLINLAVGG